MDGGALKTSDMPRRGRPPSDQSKVRIGIRLDRDVIAKFRETGEGWQTRINEALKAVKI